MKIYAYRRKQFLPQSPQEVFPFFQSAENLARITPAWLGFRILTPLPIEMKVGTLIDYTIRIGGVPVRWRTLITSYDPPRLFVDEQLKGPYSLWHHTHAFRDVEGGTEMIDAVRYILPGGILGRIAHLLLVRRQIKAIFDYRGSAIEQFFDPATLSRSETQGRQLE
jgi:ligand-binding SRPBCC domain-containing protein